MIGIGALNLEIPLILDTLIVLSRLNLMLSGVEYEKCFIYSGHGQKHIKIRLLDDKAQIIHFIPFCTNAIKKSIQVVLFLQ